MSFATDTTEPLPDTVRPWDTTKVEVPAGLPHARTSRPLYALYMTLSFLLVVSSMFLIMSHMTITAPLAAVHQRVVWSAMQSGVLVIHHAVRPHATARVSPPGSLPAGLTPVLPAMKNPVAKPTRPALPVLFPTYFAHPGQSYGQNGEQGQDYDAPYRSVALSLWSGTVFLAEQTCWDSACTSTSGGVVVVVASVAGYGMQSMYYLHLDSLDVIAGQRVKKGQLLGLTGGQIGYGHWPTSPAFTSGPHIEIGSCASFLPCPAGYNFNPAAAIAAAL